MGAYLDTFLGLHQYVQITLIAAFCFILFLCRSHVPFYVSAVISVLLGKKHLSEIGKGAPQSKSKAVIRYIDRVFVKAKVIYEVPQRIVFQEPAKVKRDFEDMIEKNRGKGVMLVLNFFRVEEIPPKILSVLKEVIEKVIEENHITVWVIFPKDLHGNMKEWHNYILELNRLENKCSVLVKVDDRAKARTEII